MTVTRTYLIAFALVALWGASSRADAQEWTFSRGDCNVDSSFDIADSIFVLGYLFATGTSPACQDACDANDDGGIDIGDAIFMLSTLFAAGTPPPAPYPGCGVDPTMDGLSCVGPVSGCPAGTALPSLEPPELAPGAPYDHGLGGGDIVQGMAGGFSPAPNPMDWTTRTGSPWPSRSSSNQIYYFNGEVFREATDLRIRGRGLDFIWARKYRSRANTATALGHNWDYSYDIFVENAPGGLVLHDGNGRADLFTLQSDGSYAADGFFHTGIVHPDDSVTFTFACQGRWEFRPLDGSPAAGRISAIIDRNGNSLEFGYDPVGRLTQVTDTLGRVIAIGYDGAGRIVSVTDFTGRVVQYAYYDGIVPGGNLGDLRSVTCPAVTGTPTDNDFPFGKTTVFTYSTGYSDARLNHNLLTVTDPKGQTFLTHTYASTTNPADLDFDRVVRQNWGQPQEVLDLTYVPVFPHLGNHFAVVRTILNDRRGTVREYFYDALNRCVIACDYTGLAVADQPTTATLNRPGVALHAGAPMYYETRATWNDDFLPRTVQLANGNQLLYTYQGDLLPTGPRRERGNLRQFMSLPGGHSPPGAQSQITETFDYAAGFGGPSGMAFVTRHVDGRGNETTSSYDASGNRLQTVHRVPSIVEDWEYNTFGQCTAHTWPSHTDPSSGARRRDEFGYHASGPQQGYLSSRVLDAGATGLQLLTSLEYDGLGNLTRVVDPKGSDALFTYNQLDQCVVALSRKPTTGGNRIATTYFYDANDNLVRTCTENRDELGNLIPGNSYITTLVEYEVLNRVTRICREVGAFDVPLDPPQLDCSGLPESEFLSTEYEYDANRNIVLERHGEAVNGNQPANVVARSYDERDLVFRATSGVASVSASTTQFDYDGNGNLIRLLVGLEDTPRETLFTFDGYDRLVSETDPMGNVASHAYDPNGNETQTIRFGELSDGPGSSANVRLAQADFTFDAMDRLVARNDHHFDPVTQAPVGDGLDTTTFEYFDDSSLHRTTDDKGHSHSVQYDSARRRALQTDAVGNTTSWSYDANSNSTSVIEVDLSEAPGVPPETYVTSFAYDGLDRCVSHVDSAGHLEQYGYDSRDNWVVSVDGRGNVVRRSFDGVDRLVRTDQFLTNTGDGSGTVIGSVVEQFGYDDSGRLTSRTDANGNTTQYQYDALGRLTSTTHADGTMGTADYDPQGNRVSSVDPNGTVVVYEYDLNDRETQRTIAPGAGVQPTTTFETRSYDGRSLLRSATNDDSTHGFDYDSLGNPVRETLNGESTQRSYDAVGNELALSYPGGRHITFEYDALDRLSSVSDTTLSAPLVMDTYQYIGLRLLRRDCATNTRLSFEYDADRRVSRTLHVRNPGLATAQVIDDRSYAWDDADNKVSVSEVTPQGSPQQRAMSYDSLGRLTSALVTNSAGTVRNTQYTYDAAGNRSQVSDGECSGSYSMDPTLPSPADAPMNQYTTTGCDQRAYDENGNLVGIAPVSGGGVQLAFDYLDRLVSATEPTSGLTHEYCYTATGLRWKRTVASVVGPIETRYFYDGEQLIEEQDALGATLRTYVYGATPRELLNMQQGGAVPSDSYFRADDLGSIVVLVNGAGFPVERYEYGDFGTAAIFDASGAALVGSSFGNRFLFHGLEYDAETTTLHELGHGYDPRVGRGLQRRWGTGATNGAALELDRVLAGAGPMANPYSGWNDLGLGPFSSPTPAASGLPTGKRQHKPFSFAHSAEPAAGSGRAKHEVATRMVRADYCGDSGATTASTRMVRADYCGDGLSNALPPAADLAWDPNTEPLAGTSYGPVITIKPKGLHGGVRVAVGDLNGDGAAEQSAPASSLPTGKRQHKPIRVCKETGAAASSMSRPVSTGDNSAGLATRRRRFEPIMIRKRVDAAEAQAGRRTYEPIVIRKRIDKSSAAPAPPARSNWGNITLKRGLMSTSLGAGEYRLVLDSEAAAAIPGKRRYANITLKRG
ncbi:MAG: DUF6531 domain-containing protein [Planctomycetota bacterium]